MSMSPLLAASFAVQLHAFAAIGAFVLGVAQFAAPKGTLPHKTVGWIWVALMLVVSISSLFIHGIRTWGPWSPIHLLTALTLVMLPFGVHSARRGRVSAHKKTMTGLFLGALLLAGLFTLMPGRIMHAVVFGAG